MGIEGPFCNRCGQPGLNPVTLECPSCSRKKLEGPFWMRFDVIKGKNLHCWTSREWLAAMAMQGLLANPALFEVNLLGADDVAGLSFDFADAMLAYQDKENDNHSGGE